MKLENFLYDLLFYFIWTTSLKFTLITFLKLPMKLRKIGDRATCFCAFRKWATCKKKLKSTELGLKYDNRKKIRLREKQKMSYTQINVLGKSETVSEILDF